MKQVVYDIPDDKTDELLKFGVEKVIWIFTDTKKILVAAKGGEWQLLNWEKEIAILGGFKLVVSDIVQ